jgi:integrase
MDKSKIEKIISANKPNIAKSTLKSYVSTIVSICKEIDLKTVEDAKKHLNSSAKKIIFLFNDKPATRIKNIMSSLIAFCDNKKTIEAYRKVLMENGKKADDDEEKQEKSGKQEENWESWDQVLKVYDQLKEEAQPLFKRDHYTQASMKMMLQYIILSMYVLIPPRRIADYQNFKIANIDKEKDNYFDEAKKQLVFNQYKTSKHYGQQTVDAPKELVDLLHKWIPIAKRYSDYLVFNSYGKGLSQPQITKLINSIFGKNISASMLRHIYVSDVVLKDVPKRTELEKIASDMGQSVEQQAMYKKF